MGNVLITDDSWTYTGDPANVPRDHLREMVYDVDAKNKLVSDNTIANALATEKNVYYAAAEVCRNIAAKFARQPPVSHEGASEQWPAVVDNYLKLAKTYAERGAAEQRNKLENAPKTIQTSKQAVKDWSNETDRNIGQFFEGMLYDPNFDPRN